LRALELWTGRPRLGFVAALTAAYAQSPGTLLATFDADFDSIPGLERWSPDTSSEHVR
jgi:predicted nucleic acid-binding protein